nr:MAG TPA: hypothetical protein [Caudoviricetes sp.]
MTDGITTADPRGGQNLCRLGPVERAGGHTHKNWYSNGVYRTRTESR